VAHEARLRQPLFFLRISVFLVFFVWTADKFIRPDHAAKVFESFYFFPPIGPVFFYVVGGLQMVLIFAFLAGYQKRITYGALLLFHAVSTLTCFKQYLAPTERILYGGLIYV